MNLGFIKSKDIKKYSLILSLFFACSINSSALTSHAVLKKNLDSDNVRSYSLPNNIDSKLNKRYKNNPNSKLRDIDNYNVLDITSVTVPTFFDEGEEVFSDFLTKTKDGGFIAVRYDYDANISLAKYDRNNKIEWVQEQESNVLTDSNIMAATELLDGSFIIVGYTYSTDLGFENKGKQDAIIVKYTPEGEQEWIINMSGSDTDQFTSVINDTDGGFVVVGYSWSKDTGWFEHRGNYDSFAIKFDKDGNKEWMDMFAGNYSDNYEDIKRTSDGGFIVSGYSFSSNLGFANNGEYDIVLVKYNKKGEREWISNFGGTKREFAYRVNETTDKGFVVIGSGRYSDIGFDSNGTSQTLIIKCDKEGRQEWIKPCTYIDEYSRAIGTRDGGILVAGDNYIVKYNEDGDEKWVKYIDTLSYVYNVEETLNKEYVIYGIHQAYRTYGLIGSGTFYMVEYKEENDEHIDLAGDIEYYSEKSTNHFYSSIETSDGGILAIGVSDSKTLGSTDADDANSFIVKYNKEGKQEWVKSFGGSDYDYFESVKETPEGDFIVVGYSTSSDADFENKGGADAIIVKYDKNGNRLWVKSFGGSDFDYFYDIVITQNEELIIVGSASSKDLDFDCDTDYTAIIAKYDKNGNKLWIKNWGGSEYYEEFLSVIETSDNNLVVIGLNSSNDSGVDFKGERDAVIVKYNQDGDILWNKSFGGSDFDSFNSVVETHDGGFVAVGASLSEDIIFDCDTDYTAIVVKYDKNGNQLWVKNWGSFIYAESFDSVVELSDNSIIAIGTSITINNSMGYYGMFDTAIVKYNQNGDMLWSKTFGGSSYDKIYSGAKSSNGGFMMAGGSMSKDIGIDNDCVSNAIIVKYDNDGNQEWLKHLALDNEVKINNFNDLRAQTNIINCGNLRAYLNNKLNLLNVDLGSLELKAASASLDIYIKSENMLSLSLDTNSVNFENYSGVQDLEMLGAVNLTVNSSLPYQINAYMPTEISNSDGSERMPIDVLNIKEGNEVDYQTFESITDKVVLKDGCTKGNGNTHSIDLKLASNQAHKADIYKTVIKFEAEQK